MSSLASRRRRSTWVMLAMTGSAIVAAVALSVVGVVALTNYEGGRDVGSELPLVTFPTTPVALLATVDEDDVLVSLTAMVLGVDGRGGSIITVPVSSDVSGGFGDIRQSLADVYAAEGADGLRFAADSTLNLTSDVFAVTDRAGTETLLAPLGPLTVDLPNDVLDGSPPDIVREAGPARLGAADAAAVLTAYASSQFDRNRRPNVAAVWSGVVGAVGTSPGEPSVADPLSSMAAFTEHLFAGPVASRDLPAAEYPVERNPQRLDVEQLDLAETILVFASIAPSAMSAPRDGLINRVVGPPGSEAKVKETIQILLFFGQNVVSVSLDGPVQEATDIVTYEERDRTDAELSSPLFGTVRFPEPTERIAGVDVVITLGSDFLAQTSPAVTTSPATTTEGTT